MSVTYPINTALGAKVQAFPKRQYEKIKQIIDAVNLTQPTNQTVTQATSITTAVTLNYVNGVITTVSATTAGAATSTFTVNNSKVLSTSIVNASIIGYSGTFTTNGLPVVAVSAVANGSFKINIMNCHATNALAGTLKISIEIC